MTPQTVRAVLAYAMTFALMACVGLAFVPLSQSQATLVGTILGAIIGNAKVPLAYFFDGVAAPDVDQPKPPSGPAAGA